MLWRELLLLSLSTAVNITRFDILGVLLNLIGEFLVFSMLAFIAHRKWGQYNESEGGSCYAFYLSLMLTILVLLFGNEPNKSQYILVIATDNEFLYRIYH